MNALVGHVAASGRRPPARAASSGATRRPRPINDDGPITTTTLSLILHHDHLPRDPAPDPQTATYYGNQEVGAYLRTILEPGATRDWRELMREATGEDLSSRAMLAYFAPLQAWLEEQNRGRTVGF
jgi:hypothetical protein